jgi:hypothetical protein
VRVSGESIERAETVRTFGRRAPGKSASSCFVFFKTKFARQVISSEYGDERQRERVRPGRGTGSYTAVRVRWRLPCGLESTPACRVVVRDGAA